MTIKINGTNTTAQPSITGTDTDTGLVYGTDEVSIVTGGTDRVKVDGSGILLVNAAAAGSKSSNAPLNVVSGSGGWGQTLRNRSNNDYAFQAFNSHDNSEQLASIALQRTGTNSGDLFFSTNGGNASATERMRILSSGGLTFNGDTATANALDDYEEGTWTPTTTNFTHTVDTSECRYTKIGRMVYLTGQLSRDQAAAPTSAVLVITGLPFLQSTVTRSISGNSWMDNGGPSVNDIVGGVTYNNNTTDIIFAISTNPAQKATTRYIQGNNFNQSRGILFSLVYITD